MYIHTKIKLLCVYEWSKGNFEYFISIILSHVDKKKYLIKYDIFIQEKFGLLGGKNFITFCFETDWVEIKIYSTLKWQLTEYAFENDSK